MQTSEITFTGQIHVKLRDGEAGLRIRGVARARGKTPEEIARDSKLTFVEPILPRLGPAPAFAVRGAARSTSAERDRSAVARWQTFALPEPRAARGVAPAPAPPHQVWDAIHSVLSQPEVEYAEPDAIHRVAVPDPAPKIVRGKREEWHLETIRAFAAWELARKSGREPGAGVLIAHLDTGFTDHPALPRERFVHTGLDFWDLKAEARDPLPTFPGLQSGHGTGTMGILAADHAKGRYRGIALRSWVLPVRVSPSVVLVRTAALARAIMYAVEEGAHVITISMGGLPSRLWADAVNYAYERGVVICAAAGNHFSFGPFKTPTTVVYPARFKRVIAVSGITKEEQRYRIAGRMSGNDGPDVDICAPTPDVTWAIAKPNAAFGYGPGEGTSTATPQVAAAAAVWLSHYADQLAGFTPTERVEACRFALLHGAEDAGPHPYWHVDGPLPRTRNDYFGDGRLDVLGALRIPPRAGLPPEPPADVDWSLLNLLNPFGAASRSGAPMLGASPEDLAARIELLWTGAAVDAVGTLRDTVAAAVTPRAARSVDRGLGSILAMATAAPTGQYRTPPDLVALHPSGWTRLPSGREITRAPLVSMDGNVTYARLDYRTALAIAAREGGKLVSREALVELKDNSVVLRPITLPNATIRAGNPRRPGEAAQAYEMRLLGSMSTLAWARIHDDEVAKLLAAIDPASVASNIGKHWIAGAPPGRSHLMGWWTGTRFTQRPSDPGTPGPHNDRHVDYSSTILLERA